MQPSLFKNYKFRCHSLGHILTYEEKISQKELDTISILENERDTSINDNGNKVKWTDNKKQKLDDLIAKRDAPDVLPAGVITHLDNIFRSVFDGRKRQVQNDYVFKGNYCEQDSLQLLSDIDEMFYEKNDEHFENDFIKGTPDNIQFGVKDMKSNYDKDSFDRAELTKIYEWQIRGYMWLTGLDKGELVYCLVNNPYHQLTNKKQHIWYQMGNPDDTNQDYINALQQLERNMIFDVESWNRNYPNYDWENTNRDFSISKIRRIKRFNVESLPKHITFIKKRVEMSRKYLMKREEEELEIIKNYSQADYKKKLAQIEHQVKNQDNVYQTRLK